MTESVIGIDGSQDAATVFLAAGVVRQLELGGMDTADVREIGLGGFRVERG
jgi:hypothetical protein